MTGFVDAAIGYAAANLWLLAGLAFLAAACEAIVVVGTVVPGTAVLLAVAALVGVAGQASQAGTVIAATIAGAIVGDGISFWLGWRLGPGLFAIWPLSRSPQWLARGRAFFDRHGGKSVFLGRFIPAVKTVVPAIAGMSRMPMGRFFLANVSSAVMWSLVLVGGGMGIGRGLDRTGLADPRAVVLGAILLAALTAAYVVLRLVLVRAVPALDAGRRRAIARLRARTGRTAAFAARVLANRDGALFALVWAALFAIAVIGFLALLAQILFDDGFARADAIIGHLVQSLRFRPLDTLMIAVTMAGDGVVLALLAGFVLVWLLACRQWRTAAATTIAFGLTVAFVPAMKAVLGRQRPHELYLGADAFSFPSGHATLSLVIFSIVALLLARGLGFRTRFAIYLAALGASLMIAFSRIYLGAHWPSDVAGGLMFGAAVIAAYAFVLGDRPPAIHARALAPALLAVFAAAYGIHLERGYDHWRDTYTYAPVTVEIDRTGWRDEGWARLPGARITLGDDSPQPFLAQIAAPPDRIATGLGGAGWTAPGSDLAGQLLSMLLPYGDLDQVRPATRLHDGRMPILTLVRPSVGNNRRLVLRLWSSGRVLADPGRPDRPILLTALSAETFEPVAFGFGDLDVSAADGSETAEVAAELAQIFAPVPKARPGAGPPLLFEAR